MKITGLLCFILATEHVVNLHPGCINNPATTFWALKLILNLVLSIVIPSLATAVNALFLHLSTTK